MSDPFKTDDIFKKSLEAKHIRTRRDKVIRKKDREIKALETENAELRRILNDFLTTEECSRTWIDEMRATIDDVLNGDKDE